MYSMQHVLWRGVMALSLLVVGGVGAGVSTPHAQQKELACREDSAYVFDGVHATIRPAIVSVQVSTNAQAIPSLTLETVTIHAIQPESIQPDA
jgi:hypothetical protein